MKIGNTIIENGIKDNEKIKQRTTVRAIILYKDRVLMLYSEKYNDFIFPGGGIKKDETHEEALKRELYEEVGARKVEVIKLLGYIEEKRHGISGSDSVYNQKSYYYICKIGQIGEPNFVGREKEDVLKAKYVDIDDVIKHNSKIIKDKNHQQKGFKTVLLRENRVLKYMKRTYLKNNL